MLKRVYVNDEDYRKIMAFGTLNYIKNKAGNKTFAAALKFLLNELEKPIWNWLFRKR